MLFNHNNSYISVERDLLWRRCSMYDACWSPAVVFPVGNSAAFRPKQGDRRRCNSQSESQLVV